MKRFQLRATRGKRASRLLREMENMKINPPTGVFCSQNEQNSDLLEASIIGIEGTAYESGVFKLDIRIPETYPFDPPSMQFTTPVYHPNVDSAGRICLDLLRNPPKGTWRPVVTISGLLTAVQILLAQPNPDDPLMPDIAEEYRYNKARFNKTAREWTEKYACKAETSGGTKRKSGDHGESSSSKQRAK